MTEFVVRQIPPHYEFRLRVSRKAPVPVPRRRRKFWARGPQEALDEAKQILKIEGPVTPETFRQAGGVWLRRIYTERRSEVIYPF